jgi:hypothetical protein
MLARQRAGIADRLLEPVVRQQQRLAAVEFEAHERAFGINDAQVRDLLVEIDGHFRRLRRGRLDVAIGALQVTARCHLDGDVVDPLEELRPS